MRKHNPETIDEREPDNRDQPVPRPPYGPGGSVGLDVMLSEAASGDRRGSSRRARLSRSAPDWRGTPRRVVGRAAGLTAELARDRRRPLRAGAGQGRPAVRGPRVGAQLAVPAAAPGVPGHRRDRRRADLRRRRRLARRAARAARRRERPRRAGPDQLRLVQSDGDQGGHRHRRRQPRPWRPASRPGSEHPAAPAGDGRRKQIRGRRQRRGLARVGRAAHRRVRADPVPAGDRPGAGGTAAVRPADDQQVLRARPLARAEHDRALRRAGTAGVRDLVAQPRAAARPLRSRHVRPGGRRGPRRGCLDHRSERGPPGSGVLGRDHHRGSGRPPRGGRRARSRGEPDADGVCARQPHRGHDACADQPGRRGGGGRRVRAQGLPRRRSARPACSRGCARTTWCGTTS